MNASKRTVRGIALAAIVSGSHLAWSGALPRCDGGSWEESASPTTTAELNAPRYAVIGLEAKGLSAAETDNGKRALLTLEKLSSQGASPKAAVPTEGSVDLRQLTPLTLGMAGGLSRPTLYPQAGATAAGTPTSEFFRSLNGVGRQITIGPATIRTFKPAPNTSPGDSSELLLDPRALLKPPTAAEDWRITALRARLKVAEDTANRVGLLDGSKGSLVQIVAQGDQTGPGALADVPPGVSVTVATIDGRRCLKVATAGDFLLDPKSMKVPAAWDPTAFPDIGLLLIRTRGAAASSATVCSFVRISRVYILTAAHCAAERVSETVWKPRRFDTDPIDAIALIPDLRESKQEPARCFDEPRACGFFVAAVRGEALYREPVVWNGTVPTPDLVLLPAVFPGAPAPSTPITIDSSTPSLTLAGYGLTASRAGSYNGYLQVGWNRMPVDLEGAVIAWDVSPSGGGAGGCVGDSGGAVFSGKIAGPNDKRRLLGLISTGLYPKGLSGIDQCLAAVMGKATKLGPHVDWICQKTSFLERECVAKGGAFAEGAEK